MNSLLNAAHRALESNFRCAASNQYGARIEGLEKLRLDEPLQIMLPGLQAKMAFVVWSRDKVSGIEFEHPLHHDVFQLLVSEFAIKHYREGNPPKLPPIRHAA